MNDVVIHRGAVPGAIGRMTELHGRYYAQHWGLDQRFEAEVARELGEFVARCDPAHDGLWVALHDDAILGAIVIDGGGVELRGADPAGGLARLRWFILDEDCQGRGIGRRLMQAAMDFSAAAGHRGVFLWTFEGLDAARRLYDDWGFRVTESFEDREWGHPVLHQRLEKSLQRPR